MTQTDLAEVLRVLRAKRGIGFVKAAEGMGIDRHTLRRLERGEGNPSYATLHKAAEYYGVTPQSLLVLVVDDTVEAEAKSPKARTPLPEETSLSEFLEERCDHAYLALPKAEFMEMFDRIPEGALERRELALEVNREYNVFCSFPKNVTPAERLSLRRMIRDAIPEVAVKHGIALMEGGLGREYQEEAARIFEVERATESATA